MPAKWCIHDLIPVTCGICSPPEWAHGTAPRAVYGLWLVADFCGTCAGCGYEFTVSDVIRSDGDDGWLCWVCGNNYGSTGKASDERA